MPRSSSSTEVATTAPAGVPDLVSTPATSIGAEDIVVPRIYIGQFMSEAVQQQLVKMGDLFYAASSDDPDPQVLDQPVRFHVLHLRKTKSFSPAPGAPLELYDYDDPNAPEKAWVVYNYTFCLPEVDTDMPFKMLLTRTGRPAAQKINTALLRNATAGPAWVNAFELSTAERKNEKGKFAVAQVKLVEPRQEDVEAAAALGQIVLRGEAQRPATSHNHIDTPDI